MVIEYEFKYRIHGNVEDLRSILRTYSINDPTVLKQHDVYLDHPAIGLAADDKAFRIRYQTDGTNQRCLVTYKGPKIDPVTIGKSREEYEIKLQSDFKDAVKMFLAMGFNIVGKVLKKREIYILGNVTVCLDTINDLGMFIEIECHSCNRTEAIRCIERIRNVISEFLGKEETKSYLELLQEQG